MNNEDKYEVEYPKLKAAAIIIFIATTLITFTTHNEFFMCTVYAIFTGILIGKFTGEFTYQFIQKFIEKSEQ